MNRDEELREALRRFNQSAATTMIATVTEVDESTATIKVDIGGGLIVEDVRMRSTIDDQDPTYGFYVVPEVGSSVVLGRIGRSDEFVVIAASSYTKIVARSSSASLIIEPDKITFNDGAKNSFGIDINQLVGKINAIEQDINNLKTIFAVWVPVPSDGGAVLKTATATWASTALTTTTKDSIKDDKIIN